MSLPTPTTPEAVFTYAAPRLKFGPGAVSEIGHDVAGLGARSALVVTDARLAATGHPERVAEALGGRQSAIVLVDDRWATSREDLVRIWLTADADLADHLIRLGREAEPGSRYCRPWMPVSFS